MLKRPTIALPQPPRIVAREIAYPRRDIWLLLLVCGFLRLITLPINQAEYTDGVLQVTQFTNPTAIWPPIYGALVYPLKFIIGYLWSGRLITVIAATLALYPIYRLTQRAFGTRAALYSSIFYIVAPVAARWGVRMMSDMLFSTFFWWACERLYFSSDERNQTKAFRAFGMACIFTVLATLTRYQGLMLLPPVAVFAWLLHRRFRKWPIKPALWLFGLLILGLWIYASPETFIHDEQVRNRAVQAAQMPLAKILLLNGEAFMAYMPYYLTYPVAVFVLIGMFWTRQRRGASFGWLMLYIAIVVLVAQSAFSSFQERYFLPLMGFFWVLAGSGMYALEERWLRHGRVVKKRLFPYVLILTYLASLAFAILVLFGQRQVFGDIAQASRFAARQAPENTIIYTNEVYRENPFIAANKVEFFAGREAKFLDNQYINYENTPNRGLVPRPPTRRIKPGSIVVLSSVYNGSAYQDYLAHYYRLVPLQDFHARVLPLLPEVMAGEPGSQNPLTWHYRYHWQDFTTRVYVVEDIQ